MSCCLWWLMRPRYSITKPLPLCLTLRESHQQRIFHSQTQRVSIVDYSYKRLYTTTTCLDCTVHVQQKCKSVRKSTNQGWNWPSCTCLPTASNHYNAASIAFIRALKSLACSVLWLIQSSGVTLYKQHSVL